MRRFIGILLLIADLSIIPILIGYYVLYTLDLLYGCAVTKGHFKTEFADYNRIVLDNIEERIQSHKDRIFGA